MTPVSMPAQLGRYKLLRPLGQGGMGAVWVALDTRLGREVALKFPLVHADANPAAIERFQREARLAASIRHPNFCPVHDVGDDQGFHFYVMPIIEGRPLADYLRTGQAWPPDRAADLVRSLALALAELHARGIVHRDLKPANVMIEPNGNVVLMDFGLARSFEGPTEGLTATGAVMGTASYMAPEQASGNVGQVGPAADVWALGVMLYQLLAGRLPFVGTGLEVLARVLHMEPEPPGEHRPDKDARLDAVCLRALSKDPRRRPESMAALAALLGDFFQAGQGREQTETLRTSDRVSDVPRPSEPLFEMPTNAPSDEHSRTEEGRRSAPQPFARPHDQGPPRRRAVVIAALVSVLLFVAVLGIVVFAGRTGEPTSGGNAGGNLTSGTPGSKPKDRDKDTDKDAPKDKPVGPDKAPVEGKPFSNSVGMDLVWIEPGAFKMGSPDGDKDAEDDERPQHRVTIKRGFWMATKEVTRGQFKEFVKETGHKETAWEKVFDGETDEHPVVRVSWNEAVAFCKWLSDKEKVLYDLPTEAEWEYCCRAGTTTKYSFGDDPGKLSEYAWYDGNAGASTHPVGLKKPNPWGLYDMHGNVWEWCKDSKRTYTKEDKTDGFSGHSGEGRVLRGGSWRSNARNCRSAVRYVDGAGLRYDGVGFRVVVLPAPRTP